MQQAKPGHLMAQVSSSMLNIGPAYAMQLAERLYMQVRNRMSGQVCGQMSGQMCGQMCGQCFRFFDHAHPMSSTLHSGVHLIP